MCADRSLCSVLYFYLLRNPVRRSHTPCSAVPRTRTRILGTYINRITAVPRLPSDHVTQCIDRTLRRRRTLQGPAHSCFVRQRTCCRQNHTGRKRALREGTREFFWREPSIIATHACLNASATPGVSRSGACQSPTPRSWPAAASKEALETCAIDHRRPCSFRPRSSPSVALHRH